MKSVDGKTFSAYVRSKLHSGYITPLTIVHIGNGCEGYSSNLFIPAKSQLTSEDETLTRHVFFLEFNDEYQDLTKYSPIQKLNLPQLMAKELEDLPN